MASNPIDCITKHAKHLSTDVNISREAATDLALKEFEKLHGELENFKKSINPKYTKKAYISPDKSEAIKKITDDYQKQIDEANTPIPEPIKAEEKPQPEKTIVEDKQGAGKTKQQEIADKVRALKVNLSKLSGGGLQSNPLGLPVAVWNGAMDIVAKTIEVTGNVADAIQKGIKYIQKNHRGQWDKKGFNDQVLKELGVRGITVNGEDLIVKNDAKTEREYAKTVNGWYSDLEQSVLDVKGEQGRGENWIKVLGKSDEAKWTGLNDWLSQQKGKVSKADIQQYLRDNRIEIVEVVKDANNKNEQGEWQQMPITDHDNRTKFSQYQVEGDKKNYKEVLVITPNRKIGERLLIDKYKHRDLVTYLNDLNHGVSDHSIEENANKLSSLSKEELLAKAKKRYEYRGERRAYEKAVEEIDELRKRDIEENTKFQSGHFDEPNILVHLRMNTRTDAEGNKVLFLEEVQSDWGQKGKREGFANVENKREFEKLKKELDSIPKEELRIPVSGRVQSLMDRMDKLENSNQTPTAPFITDTNSWTKLGLKVALKEAVRQGADKIAWTTGEQQNDRYDLSKQVEYIQYEDGFGGTKYVDISTQNSIITLQVDKDGKVLENKNTQLPDVVGKNLSDVIGKDATEKIMRGDGNKEKIDALILKGDDGKFGAVVNGKTVSDGFNTYNEAFNDYQNNPKYQNLSKIKRLEGDGLKVGGKGMKGFYGSPTENSLGIVGNVAKSLFKQEPKTVDIETGETTQNILQDNIRAASIKEGEEGDVGASYIFGRLLRARTVTDANSAIKVMKEESLSKFGVTKKSFDIVEDFIKENSKSKTLTQHSIDITPELKAEVEGGLPLFKDIKGRGKEIADLLRKGKIKLGGLQSNIAGLPIAVYNGAIEVIARALEGGATLTQAINRAYQKLKIKEKHKNFNQDEFIKKLEEATGEKFEDSEGAGKEPPIEPPKKEGGDGENKETAGITHAANEVRRQERGLPEYQKSPTTEEKLINEAEQKLKDGYDVEDLMDRLEKGETPEPVENFIRKIYIATIDAEVAKNPTDALLAKQKRFAVIGDIVNSKLGLNLWSLKGSAKPLSSISDFYVAAMEAKNTDKLTDAEKAEVQKDYADVVAARQKAEKAEKEATAKYEEMKAENELLKQQLAAKNKAKSEKVYTNGKRDFKAEIKNYKDELIKAKEEHLKWMKDNGIQTSSIAGNKFALNNKMAKIILKIAAVHVEQVGVKLAEVTRRTWEEVKDIFDGITEKDIWDVFNGVYSEKKQTRNDIVAQMRELKTEAKLLTEYENLLKGEEPKEEIRKQKRNQRLTELREKIDSFKKEKGLGKYSDEAKNEAAQKSAEKSIEDAEKKLAENDLSIKKAVKLNESSKTKDLREKRKELQKELDEKRKAAKEGKYSDESIARRAIDANKKRMEEFSRRLREGDFEKEKPPTSIYESPEFKKKNQKLYNELLDSQTEAHDAQLKFEKKLVEEEMKKWGLGDKLRNWAKKFSGTLKTLFASFDASAILIQNLPFMATNPGIGVKGVARSYKGFLKQKAFDRYLQDIHNSPDWTMIRESIRITEPKSLLESGREEFFPDRFKAIVTIKGKQYGWIKVKGSKYELMDLSKPFERQFTMLGNILRITKFRIEAEKLYEKGLTWEKNPEEFKTLGKRLNNLSSSSDIPESFQNEVTRTFIWSSRLIAAKLNMLGLSDAASMIPGLGVKKGYYRGLGVKGQIISRQQAYAAADLAKFATSVVIASYLYALARGGTLNTDPDDTGFLDVEYEAKDGSKKSMNFSGGFSRVISLIFQMASGGKRKDGVFRKYGGWSDPVKEAGRFVSGKAPPLTRTTLNIAAGKDMGGKEADIATEASNYKMPLAFGQIYKQIERDGLGALFTEGLLMYIGVNSKDSRDYDKKDNTISITDPETFKKRNVTPEEQKKYEETKEKGYNTLISDYERGKQTIWVDVNDDINIPNEDNFDKGKPKNLTVEEFDTWKEIKYSKLTPEQKKQLEGKAKRRSSAEAKKELFGVDEEE